MTVDIRPLPFLRWAGGKRWLARKVAPIILQYLETNGGCYHEPFLGSGAMFFAVGPTRARLSDVNEELIHAFTSVAQHHPAILSIIRSWPVESSTYYRIRNSFVVDPVERAARFIYLNRTCYGGLHRTNRRGQFNVPFGGGSRTPELLWRDEVLKKAAEAMVHSVIEFSVCDFEVTFQRAVPGDLIYCDPIYRAMRRGQFDRYGPEIFSWNDQERLLRLARQAQDDGIAVLISNSATPELLEMYSDAEIKHFQKKKRIGNRPIMGSTDDEFLALFAPMGTQLALSADPVEGDVWLAFEGLPSRNAEIYCLGLA